MYVKITTAEIGERFRKLVVIELVSSSPYANRYLCQCDCGKSITLTAGQLRSRFGSCGCRSKPLRVNETYNRLRSVWTGMMRRCHNLKHKNYSLYGGRGIYVIESWHKFSSFFSDMNEGYILGLQLDRVDNNLGYFKENCRWTTRVINMRNRRDVKLTEETVKEIRTSPKTTIELGKIYSIDPSHISRIKNNKVWKEESKKSMQ